jgi:hypothetical protein
MIRREFFAKSGPNRGELSESSHICFPELHHSAITARHTPARRKEIQLI